MNIDTITSEEESAFIELKKHCDGSELFSKNLREITRAELAFIHSISCFKEADQISAKIPRPLTFRTLRTYSEWCLYIYEDGSLLDSNNAKSVVYADYSDYLDQLDRDKLTLSERELFEVNSPDDDEALDFVVNIRKYFNDYYTHDELAKFEFTNNIITFSTREEAEFWISGNEPKKDQLYRCSYNEYSRPAYTIIAR